jgi:hypothetical protein
MQLLGDFRLKNEGDIVVVGVDVSANWLDEPETAQDSILCIFDCRFCDVRCPILLDYEAISWRRWPLKG